MNSADFPHCTLFTNKGLYRAYDAATGWLAARGYSVGRMQAHSPSGILLGDFSIQKWRNLRPADREALDGVLTGDFRHGPVTVALRAPAAEGFEPIAGPLAGTEANPTEAPK